MTRKAGSVGDGGSFRPVHDDGKVRVNGVVVRVWLGTLPDGCQVCGAAFDGTMADKPVIAFGGSWGNVCRRCAVMQCYPMGQVYEWTRCDDGVSRWVKVR